MRAYGDYQVERELGTGPASVVYSARRLAQTGAADRAIKVFSPALAAGVEEETRVTLSPLQTELTQAAQERIRLQKQAAEACPEGCVAPVLDHGQEGDAVWYATNLYPITLETALAKKVQFKAEVAHHLVLSIVRGALAFQRTARRSHGNLKPTNILAVPAAKARAMVVVVADPLPGDEREAERYELADLRAIGRVIYQLVRRKQIETEEEWEGVIVPLPMTAEWTAAFGRSADRWLTLCNRLLDRDLSLNQLKLEQLERELVAMAGKPLVSLKVVGAVAALLLILGLGGYFAWQMLRKGVLVVASNLPGASLTITDSNTLAVVPPTTIEVSPKEFKLAPGTYLLEARYDKLVGPDEPYVLRTNVTIAVRGRVEQTFQFEYGTVAIYGQPAGAQVDLVDMEPLSRAFKERSLGPAPQTNAWRLGKYKLQVLAKGYSILDLRVEVSAGKSQAVPFTLVQSRTDEEVVSFKSGNIRGLAVWHNETLLGQTPFRTKLPPGRYELVGRKPPWPELKKTIDVAVGAEIKCDFSLPSTELEITSVPSGAHVYVGTNHLGPTPVASLPWPPGTNVTFEFRLPYYKTNFVAATLPDGGRVAVKANLEPLGGPVRLTANLEGVRVRFATNAQPSWVVGKAGTNVIIPLGTNALVAAYQDEQLGELAPITTNVVAALRSTNQVQFAFAYGTVGIEPVPATSKVMVAQVELTNRPIIRLQIPGQPTTYRFSAAHFDPTNVTLTVTAQEALRTNVTLTPSLYPLVLDVRPPQAKVEMAQVGPLQTGPMKTAWASGSCTNWTTDESATWLLRLPWGEGRYGFTVTNALLAPVSQWIEMREQGVTQKLHLAHAKVTLRTTQSKLKVTMDGAPTVLGETPLTTYVPPGSHRFTFSLFSQFTNSPSYDLTNGQHLIVDLPYQFLPASFTNSIGMPLVYFEPGNFYVGRFEVTCQQWSAVSKTNFTQFLTNRIRGGTTPTAQHPISALTWEETLEFCRLLSADPDERAVLRANELQGWQYAMPTEEEWRAYAPPTNLDSQAVFLVGFTRGAALPVDWTRQSSNQFGIYDLYGNVSEWCLNKSGSAVAMGGDFQTPKAPGVVHQFDLKPFGTTYAARIGFRILLKPR